MPSPEHKMPIEPKYGTFDPNDNVEHQPPTTKPSPRHKSKELTHTINIYLFLITLALCTAALFLSLDFLGNAASILSPPFTTPPKDWNGFTKQAWAVGIDFSAGYVTASVAFDNGTVVGVERVRGGERYEGVLGGWARGEGGDTYV